MNLSRNNLINSSLIRKCPPLIDLLSSLSSHSQIKQEKNIVKKTSTITIYIIIFLVIYVYIYIVFSYYYLYLFLYTIYLSIIIYI